MIQDKAQFEENGESLFEGRSASRTATLVWVIWITPFGRVAKHSSELLSLLAMARHYLRASSSGQTLRSTLITQTYVEGAQVASNTNQHMAQA